MPFFAEIDSNNIVVSLIVDNHAFINSGARGAPTKWVETDRMSSCGVHYDTNGTDSGQPALRMNSAVIGGTYDVDRDAFIPPKPFDSWSLNDATCSWVAPVEYPSDDTNYQWDESLATWVSVV